MGDKEHAWRCHAQKLEAVQTLSYHHLNTGTMGRLVHVNNVPRDKVQACLDVLVQTCAVECVNIVELRSVGLAHQISDTILCQIQFKVLPSCLNQIVKALRGASFSDFDVL